MCDDVLAARHEFCSLHSMICALYPTDSPSPSGKCHALNGEKRERKKNERENDCKMNAIISRGSSLVTNIITLIDLFNTGDYVYRMHLPFCVCKNAPSHKQHINHILHTARLVSHAELLSRIVHKMPWLFLFSRARWISICFSIFALVAHVPKECQ